MSTQKPSMRVLDKLPQVQRRSFLAGAAGMSVVPVTALSMAPTALQNSWGVPAQALAKPANSPPHWACFAGLSPWEVVADGRKLVGLAQVRRSTGVLLTAGVLVSPPDWALLCQAMGKPLTDAMDLECATTSVSAYGGHAVTAHDVFPALALAVQQALHSFLPQETL